MKLNDEKSRIALAIDREMDASELDELLRQLAEMRAEMRPAIAQTRAELDGTEVLVEDKPGLVIAALTGGGFRLWLRHRGFGWLAYQIDNRAAIGMRDYISARAAGVPDTDLFSDQGSNLH